MSNCELQTEVGQLYAMIKQLVITTEELRKEILDIRKDYATIMVTLDDVRVTRELLETQIYNFASLVTGQNGVQNRHETPESPRSPPTLSTDDMCGTEVAWTM
jgi:hypothetical protein